MSQLDPRSVAALAVVLRRLYRDALAAGAKLDAEATALSVVDAWLRDGVPQKQLSAAATRIYQEGGRLIQHPLPGYIAGPPPPKTAMYWLASATSALLWSLSSGRLDERVLNQAAFAATDGDLQSRQRYVARLHIEAQTEVAQQTFAPVAPSPQPAPDPPSKSALDASKRKLPPPIRPLLDLLRAERRPGRSRPREELRELLVERGYHPHEAVLRFEEEYGGLILPEPGVEDWFGAGQYTLFGTWSWLDENSGNLPPEDAKRGLVPAFVDPRGIGYLDSTGRGHVEDEIEGMLDDLDIPSGKALVVRTILFLLCPWTGGRKRAGLKGAAWATALGAKTIACVSGERERWWACDDFVVRESDAKTQAWALRRGGSKRLTGLK